MTKNPHSSQIFTTSQGLQLCFNEDSLELSLEIEFTRGKIYPAVAPSLNDPGYPAEGGEITIMSLALGLPGSPKSISDSAMPPKLIFWLLDSIDMGRLHDFADREG